MIVQVALVVAAVAGGVAGAELVIHEYRPPDDPAQLAAVAAPFQGVDGTAGPAADQRVDNVIGGFVTGVVAAGGLGLGALRYADRRRARPRPWQPPDRPC